jgi:hypothetical protein
MLLNPLGNYIIPVNLMKFILFVFLIVAITSCKQKKIIINYPCKITEAISMDSGINISKLEYCILYPQADSVLMLFYFKGNKKSNLSIIYQSSSRFLKLDKFLVPIITRDDIYYNSYLQSKGYHISPPYGCPLYLKIYTVNSDSCRVIKKGSYY